VTEDAGARAGHDGTSLTEEIRLLVEMVVEHATPWVEGLVSAGHGQKVASHEHPSGEQTENCGWCPLCAIVAVVRGERPEFAARLLEQAAQLIALLRAVLADRWEPQEGVHMPGFHPAPKPASRNDDPAAQESTEAPAMPSQGRVQHIAVRKRAEWQPDREN
jgi:hypothetical protein